VRDVVGRVDEDGVVGDPKVVERIQQSPPKLDLLAADATKAG
jgi:hypothetical protein